MAVFETGEQIFAIAPTAGGRFKAFGKFLLFAVAILVLVVAAGQIATMALLHIPPREAGQHATEPLFMLTNEALSVVATLALTVALAVVFREPVAGFGLGLGAAARRRGRDLALGVGTGFLLLTALLGAIALLGGFSFGHVTDRPMEALKYGALFLVLFSLVAVFEELMFRGYALVQMSRAIGFWPAALVMSVLFGAVHAGNAAETPVGLAAAGAIGLVFCYSFYRSGSLMWALGFHAAWDYSQNFIWGVPDSGIVTPGSLFVSQFHGPTWLTGGVTGPEASWLIAPVILLGVAAAHFMLKATAPGRYR